MTRVAALMSAVAGVAAITGGAPSAATASQTPTTVSTPASYASSRPFTGIRYFYVPSQNRYRAVKFSPRAPGRPAGSAAGAYSTGSCFSGEKRGSTYVGTLYSLPSGPTYTRSYTLNDLFFGQVTYNAPAWFKRIARSFLNGNGSCAVW